MKRPLKSWIALLILAALAFSHASFAMAACGMQRGDMGQMAAVEGEDCCDREYRPVPSLANDCLAHCTADLQLCGQPLALVPGPADAAIVLWPEPARSSPARAGPGTPPARTIAFRILLHSFLI